MNFLTIPGLHNSGEAHWQTRWENLHPGHFSRVNQYDWEKPVKTDWVHHINSDSQLGDWEEGLSLLRDFHPTFQWPNLCIYQVIRRTFIIKESKK